MRGRRIKSAGRSDNDMWRKRRKKEKKGRRMREKEEQDEAAPSLS